METDWKKHARIVSIAATAGIPFAGGPLAVLLENYWPDIQRDRIFAFLNKVDQNLYHKISVEELATNNKFISAVQRLSLIAMGDHRAEKIELLKNAALNSAFDSELNEDIMFLFIESLDKYAATHINILKFDGKASHCQPKDYEEVIASVICSESEDWQKYDSSFLAVHAFKQLERDGMMILEYKWVSSAGAHPRVVHFNGREWFDIAIKRTELGSKFLSYLMYS